MITLLPLFLLVSSLAHAQGVGQDIQSPRESSYSKSNALKDVNLPGGTSRVFDSFPSNRSEATKYYAYNIGNENAPHYVYSYTKGLSFLPPPHLHNLILKKIVMMELPELRETVTELVEDVIRTEKALSQMDTALVVQVKRLEATEKAFSDLEKKLDQQSGIISQVLALKNELAIQGGRLEGLSKIVIAEWEQVGSSRVKPHTVAKSWDDASHHCQVYSASLVRVNDEESNRKISDLIQYESSPLHWIGVEGRQSVDRSPFHRFAKPTRVCIALEKGGSWASRDCSEKLPFICGYEDGSTSLH